MKYIKSRKEFKFKFGDIVKITYNHMYDNDIFKVIFTFAGLDGNYYVLKSLITNDEKSHMMEEILEFADEEQIAALKYNL